MVAGRAHDGWTMVATPSAAETLLAGPSLPLLALFVTSIFVLVGCGVALLVRYLATTKPTEESRWWPAARATGGQWWPLVDSGGSSVWTTVASERPASAVEGGAQGGQDVMYQYPLLFVARGSKGHRRSSRLSM